MRWDVRVTAHLYLSASFLSVCVMAAPDYLHLTDSLKAVGFWGGLSGAIFFAFSGFRAAMREERAAPKLGHRRRMISIYGMIVCGVGFLGFAAAYFWPGRTPVVPVVETVAPLPKATPRYLFENEIRKSHALSHEDIGRAPLPEGRVSQVQVGIKTFDDYYENTTFTAVYIPRSTYWREIYGAVADRIIAIVEERKNTIPRNRDLVFTKRIVVYYDNLFLPKEENEAFRIFSDKGLIPDMRGIQYASTKTMTP